MIHGNGAAAASAANIAPITLTTAAPTLNDAAGGTSHYSVSTATKVSGGSSYTANDVLTVSGGTAGTTCQITVDTVSGGVIQTAHVSRAGDYTVQPSNAVSVTGGTGSGATFNLTFSTISTTYYVKVTLVFPFGEQIVSSESNRSVSTSRLLTVASPSATLFATGYNVYAGTTTNTETLQNVSPIAIGTGWTMPVSGLISGSSMPTTLQIDASVGQHWIATLAGAATLANPANLAAGDVIRLWFSQDSTGSRTLTYGSQWQAAGTTSTVSLSTTASAKDLVIGIADTATTITASIQKAIAH